MSRFITSLFVFGLAMQSVSALAMIERRIERTFDVPLGADLRVNTVSGLVNVIEVPFAKTIEVSVIQTAPVATEAQMDKRLRAIVLDMKQDGGVVSINAKSRWPVIPFWVTSPPVTLTYVIKVPRRCDVTVTTSDANIEIGELQGRMILNNEKGNIFTAAINGPVTAKTRGGSIAITAATGPISAHTALGEITVGRAGSSALLVTKGGYIELQRASGAVTVKSNGSGAAVGFVTPIKFPATISTSGGDVALSLDSDSNANLDLKASVFGAITLKGPLPFKVTGGAVGSSSLKGLVNQGGSSITVDVSGGSIEVQGFAPIQDPMKATAATTR